MVNARKLSDEQVRDIRRRLVTGLGQRGCPDSQLSLSKFYGVPQSTISRIWSGRLYKNVKP